MELQGEWHETIVKAIGARLAEDGFTRPTDSHIFVRPIHGPWRAWIAVPGGYSALDPAAGIMNEELNDIFYRAWEMLGKNLERRPDTPPLLRAELERLAADCPACSTAAPWQYHGKRLSLDVANDVVMCLRKFAYPFFDKYASLQGLIDASKVGFVGFAFALFAPIVLVQLGRVEDAKTYSENWLRRLPQDEVGLEYREFYKVLFKMLT